MNIRLETPKDYRVVENLTREAFWNVQADDVGLFPDAKTLEEVKS